MGGPCFLLLEVAPAADAAATLNASRADEQQEVERTDVKWDLNSIPRKVRRRLTAPRCTDNFAVDPFAFDGELWQSVEQCYQAYKFLDASVRKEIRTMVPHAGESDHSHGMRVWSAGGSSRSKLRSDWDAVKVEVMLRSCRAKYAAHAHLREQLLTTGDVQIIGAPSTEWVGASGHHGWSAWNGRVQMLLRHEMQSAVAGAQPTEAHTTLQRQFAEYMSAEGGQQHPLPGDSD